MEKRKQSRTTRGKAPPPSSPAWWKLELQENPSDELEASSYGCHHLVAATTVEQPKPKKKVAASGSTRKASDRSRQRTGSMWGQEGSQTTAILDILEKNICSFDYIDSQALRNIEESLKSSNIEEQLERLNQSTWKMWQDCTEADDSDTAYTDDDESAASRPLSPVASTVVSYENPEDILEELSKELGDLKVKKMVMETLLTKPSENETKKAKQSKKAEVKSVHNEDSETVKDKSSETVQDEPKEITRKKSVEAKAAKKEDKAAKKEDKAAKKEDKAERKRKKKEERLRRKKEKKAKKKESIAKAKSQKAKKKEAKSVSVVKDTASNASSARTAQEIIEPPEIPELVHAAKADEFHDELELIMDAMSSLTEEGHILGNELSPRPLIGESTPKSCVPGFVNKRFDVLKKIKLATTASTIQSSGDSMTVMRVTTGPESDRQDDSTVCANTTYYIYDYDSAVHTYVAYFRRSATASESLRLYQHLTPPSFNTMKSEVVIKIDASTVSPTDCLIRKGEWWGESSPNTLNLPIVPGVAFLGRVETIDESTMSKSGLKKGDRVVSLVRVGANSRHLCIEYTRLVKVPSEICEASGLACLPEVYLAAFQALHMDQRNGPRYRKNSLSNKSILILGGGSGTMGRALIEVAKAAGARTVYATARDKEFSLIEDIGGLPLSRDPKHWLSLMVAKMDIIISLDDPYAKPELKYSHIQTLSSEGKLVVIGAPDQGEKTTVDLDDFDARDTNTKRKMHNYNVFDAWERDLKQGKKDLAHLLKMYKDGSIKPQILERIPLNKVPNAHDYFDSKKVTGFVLCEPWIAGTRQDASIPPNPATTSSFSVNESGKFPMFVTANPSGRSFPSKGPLRGGSCGTPGPSHGNYKPFGASPKTRTFVPSKRILV